MTCYQKILSERAPNLNPEHMETLAVAIGSTLNGLPILFFDEVAKIAVKMGPQKLADFHNNICGQ